MTVSAVKPSETECFWVVSEANKRHRRGVETGARQGENSRVFLLRRSGALRTQRRVAELEF